MEGSPYFTNILDIAFELYVLVTTANSPDVMYVSHQVISTDICYITESTFLKATVGEKNGDFLFIAQNQKSRSKGGDTMGRGHGRKGVGVLS